MRHSVLFAIATLFCFTSEGSANPISIFGLPFISEVQMTDSTHWSIELGGTKQVPDGNSQINVFVVCAANFIHPPCSTTLFRLRITSSGNVYTTKIYFDTADIAVLTRASITGIPQTEEVVIQANDTIQILDTAWHSVSDNNMSSWKFVVRPVKPGNSLVNVRMWQNPFETTRPSIGSRGNYTTLYNLFLRDSLNNLLPAVYVYEIVYDEVWDFYFVSSTGTKLTTPVIYPVSVNLQDNFSFYGNDWRGFLCDSVVMNRVMQGAFPGTQWSANYIDTIFSIQDTVICPCATGVKNTKTTNKHPGVRFSALPSSSRGITFVIATSDRISDATVGIFTVTGKELASLKVPAIGLTGTYSLTWDGAKENQKKIPAGTYLCKLVVNGGMIASQKVAVR